MWNNDSRARKEEGFGKSNKTLKLREERMELLLGRVKVKKYLLSQFHCFTYIFIYALSS